MRPILTLTPNPALDLSTSVDGVRPGVKLRCGTTTEEPGGGGVNVSRAVHQLGGSSEALVALGGGTGDRLEKGLRDRGLEVIRFAAPGDTRQSIAVTDGQTGEQYRFSLPGPDWFDGDVTRFLEAIEMAVKPDGISVLSGSLPPGMGVDVLPPLAAAVAAGGAELVVDTSGEALRLLATPGIGPAVLRMDHAEARFLSGTQLASIEEVRVFAASLTSASACVIVAIGARGSVMALADGSAWHAGGADVPVASKVGAGDSFVGGFVLARARGQAPEKALQFGMAAASAAVMTDGTELCRREDTERLVSACLLTAL